MGLVKMYKMDWFRKKKSIEQHIPELKSPIKVFRLKNNYWVYFSGYKYNKGTIFVQWESEANDKQRYPYKTWRMATPLSMAQCSSDYLLNEFRKINYLEEIELTDLIKFKPHWHKEFKDILKHYNIKL